MEIKAEPVHCSIPDVRAKEENLEVVNAFIKQETDDDCQVIHEENLRNMKVECDFKREFPDVVHEDMNFIAGNSTEALHEKLFAYNHTKLHTELKTLKEKKPYPDICLSKGTHKPNLKLRIVSLKKGKPNISNETMKLATAGYVVATLYMCNMCGFEGTSKQNLYEHMNLHTGKKPYKCILCGFETALMGHLKFHLKTHAYGTVYKSNGYEFKADPQQGFNYPVNVSTANRSYECDVCEFKTSFESAFDCHICIRPRKRKIQKINCRLIKIACKKSSQKQKIDCSVVSNNFGG